MSIPQTIKFVADTSNLETAINKLNKQIGVLNNKGKINFDSSGAEKSLDNIDKKAKKSSMSVDGLGKTFKSLATVIGGSVIASIAAFNSGLNELSKGLTTVMSYRANQYFNSQATAIQAATNGFVNYGEALKVAKDIPDFVSAKDIRSISKLAATLELANGSAEKTGNTLKELMWALRSGEVKETIQQADPALFMSLRNVQRNKNFSMARKQQEMLIVMQQKLRTASKETNNVLNSGMSKLLGVVNALTEKFKSFGGVIKGVGLIAAGVLGPLGAGLAGFMLGGPIVGLITTAVGGVITAIFGSKVIDLIKAIREGKNPVEALTNKLSLFITKLNAFVEGLLGGKFDEKIMNGTITAALKSMGLENTEANKQMVYKDIENYFKWGKKTLAFFEKVAEGGGDFGKGFGHAFDETYNKSLFQQLGNSVWNESIEKFKELIKKRGEGGDSFFGRLYNKIKNQPALAAGEATGVTLGSLAGMAVGILKTIAGTLLSIVNLAIMIEDNISSLVDTGIDVGNILKYIGRMLGIDVDESGKSGKGAMEPGQPGDVVPTSGDGGGLDVPAAGTPKRDNTSWDLGKYFKDVERLANAVERLNLGDVRT